MLLAILGLWSMAMDAEGECIDRVASGQVDEMCKIEYEGHSKKCLFPSGAQYFEYPQGVIIGFAQ